MNQRQAIAIHGLLALTLCAAPAWAQTTRRQPRPEHDLRTYGVVESVQAIELLDRAVTERFQDKAGLMSDPDLAGVRSDPRFAGIVKKLG